MVEVVQQFYVGSVVVVEVVGILILVLGSCVFQVTLVRIVFFVVGACSVMLVWRLTVFYREFKVHKGQVVVYFIGLIVEVFVVVGHIVGVGQIICTVFLIFDVVIFKLGTSGGGFGLDIDDFEVCFYIYKG